LEPLPDGHDQLLNSATCIQLTLFKDSSIFSSLVFIKFVALITMPDVVAAQIWWPPGYSKKKWEVPHLADCAKKDL